MAKREIVLTDGTRMVVEGKRFCHYIDNIQFWFFLHESTATHSLTITEWESGKKVVDLTHTARCHFGNDKTAARAELDSLVARVGAARVRSVLVGA